MSAGDKGQARVDPVSPGSAPNQSGGLVIRHELRNPRPSSSTKSPVKARLFVVQVGLALRASVGHNKAMTTYEGTRIKARDLLVGDNLFDGVGGCRVKRGEPVGRVAGEGIRVEVAVGTYEMQEERYFLLDEDVQLARR